MYLYGKYRSLNNNKTKLRNHPYDSIEQGYGHALAPLVIVKDHGHLLIKSAQHSLALLINSALNSYMGVNCQVWWTLTTCTTKLY